MFIMKYWLMLKNLSRYSVFMCRCRDRLWNRNIIRLLEVMLLPYAIVKSLGYFRVRETPGRKGLAFVLIAKNEAPYIKEWLDFHYKRGVSHFIIYDNESTDNLCEVLNPYIEAGVVSYHVIRGKVRQNDAYNMAIYEYGHKFKYMGFIDADEFMFVRNSRGVVYVIYAHS